MQQEANEFEIMKPRLYQEKILSTAAEKNTLVVLPTGLGKSLIAKLLVDHRLKKNPNSKVIFFAPTRPLASQHIKLFLKDYQDDLILLTGNTKPENRKISYETKKIIISTPQGFENDLINKLVDLNDVSLMIFDEAHHATGNYAYSFIASQYRKIRNHLILGLTASPGSNQESIQEVINNLGIEAIEYRSRDDPDVKPYVKETDVKYIYVDFPDEFMRIKKALENCLNERIVQLKGLNVFKFAPRITKKDILSAQAQVHGLIAKGEMSSEHYVIISILAEVTKIQHALELLETQGIMQLDTYFSKIFENDTSKAAKKLFQDNFFIHARTLTRKLAESYVIHPKISAMLNLIIKFRHDNFKAIVFTQYRDSAKQIIERLNLLENIDARLFVGQSKKNGSGLSQKNQIQMLKDFSDGKFNILVSSSVGEEGLDIPSVDLVVFYEPVPSAIRSIQRRGRTGRSEDGHVFILTTRGTRDEAYKWSAHYKEKNQYNILNKFTKEMFVKKKETFFVEENKSKYVLKENIAEIEKENNVKINFKENNVKHDKQKINSENTVKLNFENNSSQTKMDDFDNIKIIADYREKSSDIFKYLMDEGANIELKQLPVADYVISEKIAIEFKTVKDFVDSIVDGRLLEQLKNLSSNYLKPILIVQGTEDIFSIRKIHANAIRGMIASITIGFGFNIIYTKDSYDSAMMIYQIARREQRKSINAPYFHSHKTLRNDNEELEYVVSSIQGVGTSTARDLLSYFKTIENIFSAQESELIRVKGVGKETAKKIKEIYLRKYI